MKYKDMMNYPKKKKKVIKEKVNKPKKPTIVESLKEELNEWSYQPPTIKRWSGGYGKSLTEFEKRGGKDTLKENEENWNWSLDWESDISSLINSRELKTLMRDKNSKVKTIAQRLQRNLKQVHIGFDGLTDELGRVYGEGTIKEVGAGVQYRKFYKDIERQQQGLSKSVEKFKKYLEKQGLKSEATKLYDNYLMDSYGWIRKWLKKFIGGLM